MMQDGKVATSEVHLVLVDLMKHSLAPINSSFTTETLVFALVVLLG